MFPPLSVLAVYGFVLVVFYHHVVLRKCDLLDLLIGFFGLAKPARSLNFRLARGVLRCTLSTLCKKCSPCVLSLSITFDFCGDTCSFTLDSRELVWTSSCTVLQCFALALLRSSLTVSSASMEGF